MTRLSKAMASCAILLSALLTMHTAAVVTNLRNCKLDMLIVLGYDHDAPLSFEFNPMITRAYLHNFRATKQDIHEFETESAGAAFVTHMSNLSYAQKGALLDFLISKGLDVNRANIRGEVPLSGPVLFASVEDAKLLLNRGAKVDIPVWNNAKRGPMTAIELAHFLQNHPSRNRDFSQIITVLEKSRS